MKEKNKTKSNGNDEKEQIEKFHIYKDMMNYLDENRANRNNINKSLLINKFTGIHNLGEEYNINQSEKDILKSIKKDNETLKNNLQKRFDWINLQCKVNDKLIIGLGNESVFETGITLHHTYGIPYIPGQAIKGVLRNYIMQKYQKYFQGSLNDCNEDYEKVVMRDKSFSLIFGGKNQNNDNICGKVIFMDSFPCNDFKIERDVMTPHHAGYYNENKSPKLPWDSDEPTPISFLVVEKDKDKDTDLLFDVNIAISKEISDIKCDIKFDVEDEKTMEEFVLGDLIDTLEFHGIGAKTSVGYGYFDIDKEKVKKQIDKNKEELLKMQKTLEEDKKFKEDTKNMSSLEIQLYKFNKLPDGDQKNDIIMKFYNDNINSLETKDKDKERLALYMKEYLDHIHEWKIKKDKKGNVKGKRSEKVKEICKILKIELPV